MNFESLVCRHEQAIQTVTQSDREVDRCSHTDADIYTNQTKGDKWQTSHISTHPPPPPLGLSSWMIFDESWTCWSRNPCRRTTRPERHFCSVWRASCVIYDLVMRQHSGQLDKGYSSKMRLSWLLLPWEDEGLDVASGDFDRCVNGIHKRGVFFLSTLSEVDSDVCVGLIISLYLKVIIDQFLVLIYKTTNDNQIAKLIKKSR